MSKNVLKVLKYTVCTYFLDKKRYDFYLCLQKYEEFRQTMKMFERMCER